ncbi:hypothetical protein QR98_0052320 [Sarcoptes scabiei]|uniref:Uncharacterized protein n=1 Tax=Sarcoptes scabiei TaxID=52283 RepID=A0A132A729_SARSC|nr:hypothetical protein QR98_0052320 [Sarcoptes scabiei]
MPSNPFGNSVTNGVNDHQSTQSSSPTSSIISESNGLSYTNLDLTNNSSQSYGGSNSGSLSSTSLVPHSPYQRSQLSQQYSTNTGSSPNGLSSSNSSSSQQQPSTSPLSTNNLYSNSSQSYKDYVIGGSSGSTPSSSTPETNNNGLAGSNSSLTQSSNSPVNHQISTSPVQNNQTPSATADSLSGHSLNHLKSSTASEQLSLSADCGGRSSAGSTAITPPNNNNLAYPSYFDANNLLTRSSMVRNSNSGLSSMSSHLQNGLGSPYGLMDPSTSLGPYADMTCQMNGLMGGGGTLSYMQSHPPPPQSQGTLLTNNSAPTVPQYKWMQVKRNIPKPDYRKEKHQNQMKR